jgi:hypothetical protein
MQGFCHAMNPFNNHDDGVQQIAYTAVKVARALLQELEKEGER